MSKKITQKEKIEKLTKLLRQACTNMEFLSVWDKSEGKDWYYESKQLFRDMKIE